MKTPAKDSTLTYKMLRYREELRRHQPIAKRILDTKLDLTVGLIGECCNNIQYCDWNDLDAFIRQAKFRKFLYNARQSLWPTEQDGDDEKELETEEKRKLNKIVLECLQNGVKKMDFL
uniref:Uncharacterized protein n=1 Tax=Bactrocera dorsalis TaxID=27457 RepID=A0A034VQJ1_BACDO